MNYNISYNSKKYYPGSIFLSKNYGSYKILGRALDDNIKLDKFIIQFIDTNYITTVKTSTIKSGEVKDPYFPIVHNVGYIGEGIYNSKNNSREYALWNGMITRCYSKSNNNPSYKNVSISSDWFCFQNFANDIKYLENYNLWLINKEEYQLDKDVLQKDIINKIYSKDTCKFLTKKENSDESIYRNILTKVIIAKRISDEYVEEFYNQHEFGKKYNLLYSSISSYLRGIRKSPVNGWIFKYK